MTAITTAARLLRVAADELKNAHTLGGDWGNEHEALDAYNEHMATATTLEHMARQCLAQIEEPAGAAPAAVAPQGEDWRKPTTYLQRFGDAIALLCHGRRPDDLVLSSWLDGSSFVLQQFAIDNGPAWAQGIGLIDAATIAADQPTEGVAHEMRADQSSAVSVPTEGHKLWAVFRQREDENDGKEFLHYALWHKDTILSTGERYVEGYFVPLNHAAAPALEAPAGVAGRTVPRNDDERAAAQFFADNPGAALQAWPLYFARDKSPALEAPAVPERQVLTDAQITHLQETRVGEPSPSRPIDASDWTNFARAIEAAVLATLAKCDPAWRQGQRELLQYVARRACDPALPVDVVRAAHAAMPDELAARLRKAAATLAVRHSSYSNISIAWPDEKLLKSAEGRYHQALADLDALIAAIPGETKQTADRDQLDSLARKKLGALLNAFGESQWQAGRGVPCPSIEDAFEAVISAAVDLLAAAPQAPAAPWKDHQTARLVNDLRDCAIKYHGARQLRERIAHIVVPLCDQLKGALAAPAAPAVDAWLQPDDMAALQRFHETAEDDESYDIGKEAVARLCAFGCLQSHSFGRYSTTDFGDYLLDTWAGARTLPFTTAAERAAQAAAKGASDA
ncbi:MAG: hypothetical protein JNM01_12290 [Delftia acidovorans]|nr:hypothetical protein [Delftia acidovorans]